MEQKGRGQAVTRWDWIRICAIAVVLFIASIGVVVLLNRFGPADLPTDASTDESIAASDLSDPSGADEANNTGASSLPGSSGASSGVSSIESGSSAASTSSDAPVSSALPEDVYHAVPLIPEVTPVAKGDPVDDDYFSNAVFIGDSRTEGLILYGDLPDTTAYTNRGMSVSRIFTDKIVTQGDQKVTVFDALRSKPSFGKVYLMLGVNELGWVSIDDFISYYGKIIDEIRGINPNAVIYIQSVIPVTAAKSKSDKIYNNDKIASFNARIQKMAVDKQVPYLNVAEGLVDESGCLPDGSTFDGVHLNGEYCIKWTRYLRCHTVS